MCQDMFSFSPFVGVSLSGSSPALYVNSMRFIASLWLWMLIASAVCIPARRDDTLNRHRVVLDAQGKLLSWVQPQETVYDRVMRLAWDFLLRAVPVERNGLKTFFVYSCIDEYELHGRAWPHNPAGIYAMMADSAAAYYAYSGDRAVVDLVAQLLDYQLAHGTTPPGWAWGAVPYASSDHGATEYRGAHDFKYDKKHPGRGDG